MHVLEICAQTFFTDAVCNQKRLNITVYSIDNKCYWWSVIEDWYEFCELNFGLGLERCLKYGQAEMFKIWRGGYYKQKESYKQKFRGGKCMAGLQVVTSSTETVCAMNSDKTREVKQGQIYRILNN